MIKDKIGPTKSELPPGWVNCKFGEIAKIRSGFAFKSSWFKKTKESTSDVPLIRQSQLKKSTVDLSEAVFLDRKFYERFSEFRISKDDILIGMSGAIGRVCTYTNTSPSLQNQRTGKIEPHALGQIYLKFLGFFLSYIGRTLSEKAKGMGVQNISAKDICALFFPMPPLNEQYRIVAKIEELFSELNKGIESLKAARAKLKEYRQSVLKHAFEGKLTAQWREENKEKLESPEQLLARIKQEREAYHEQQLQKWKASVKNWEDGGKSGRKPAKPKMLRSFSDFADNQPLNDMWPIFELGDLISVSSGQSLTSKAMKGGRYPVYGGNGITGYHDEYLVSEPTLIIGRVGAKCGVTHITSENSWITDNALIASPLIRSFDKCYFKFLLEQKNLNILGSSTGQPVISGAKIYPVHIPLPTLAEQMQIGDAIEKANSLIDDQRVAIDNQLQKAEALRQSILKKAFSGQLVAQDPNDEPASILLDRIRVEKTAQSKINTRAKRRRKAATT